MRKEIIVVKIQCDSCKTIVDNSTIVLDKYDICEPCKDKMVLLFESGSDEMTTIEKPKRGRKKKDDVIELLTIEEKDCTEVFRATHENVAHIIKEMSLDMRNKLHADRVQKALTSLEGVDYSEKEKIDEDFRKALAAQIVYFADCDEHKEKLRELLLIKGWEFSIDAHREEASEIKHQLLESRVDINDLVSWVAENVPTKSHSDDEPF